MLQKLAEALTSTKAQIVAAMAAVTALGQGVDWIEWARRGPESTAQIGVEVRELREEVGHVHDVLEAEPWDKLDSLESRFTAYDSAARIQRERRAKAQAEADLEAQRTRFLLCEALGRSPSECEP